MLTSRILFFSSDSTQISRKADTILSADLEPKSVDRIQTPSVHLVKIRVEINISSLLYLESHYFY